MLIYADMHETFEARHVLSTRQTIQRGVNTRSVKKTGGESARALGIGLESRRAPCPLVSRPCRSAPHRLLYEESWRCNDSSKFRVRGLKHGRMVPVSVKEALLLRKPLPCSPAAETALEPLIWCSES